MIDASKLKSIPTDWKPITNQADLAILGKLIEELSECSSVAARCIIQGIDETNPETSQTNAKRLKNEIADVLAMVALATDIYQFDTTEIDERVKIKYAHKMQWYLDLSNNRN